jgi:hypothetical protein
VRLKYLTTCVAIAGALTAPVIIAANASADTTGGVSSAYGVSATGLVNLPAIPTASSVSGPKDKSLVELPPNPLVKLKVLHTTATARGSRASVVDLKVVKASLGGHKLAVDAAPNSAVNIPVQGLGAVSVVLNKQVHNPDGSLTVTAIEVKLGLVGGKGQAIDISSATCAAGDATPPNTPGSPTTPPTTTPPGEAPAPTPVPSDLPVTG